MESKMKTKMYNETELLTIVNNIKKKQATNIICKEKQSLFQSN